MNKKELLAASKEELIALIPKCSVNSNTNCNDCNYCYNCWYCHYCGDCNNCDDCNNCHYCNYCHYCGDCNNCDDCWGCDRQQNKQYMICNVQLTKKEYEAKIKELT